MAYVQSVIEKQTLGTFCFHGIGAEHLTVSTEAHEELLQWLAEHKKEAWVTTFGEATSFVRQLQTK